MEIIKDIVQVLVLTLIGVGLLALGRRDPVRQRTLTVLGIIVLVLALARIVVILV